MNVYKIYKYANQLFEILLTSLYCIGEFVFMIYVGVYIATLMSYFCFVYDIETDMFMYLVSMVMTVIILLLYTFFIKMLKYLIKRLEYPAIYFAMIGQIVVYGLVLEFYYGDDLFSLYGILAIIVCAMPCVYFIKDGCKLSKKKVLEVR